MIPPRLIWPHLATPPPPLVGVVAQGVASQQDLRTSASRPPRHRTLSRLKTNLSENLDAISGIIVNRLSSVTCVVYGTSAAGRASQCDGAAGVGGGAASSEARPLSLRERRKSLSSIELRDGSLDKGQRDGTFDKARRGSRSSSNNSGSFDKGRRGGHSLTSTDGGVGVLGTGASASQPPPSCRHSISVFRPRSVSSLLGGSSSRPDAASELPPPARHLSRRFSTAFSLPEGGIHLVRGPADADGADGSDDDSSDWENQGEDGEEGDEGDEGDEADDRTPGEKAAAAAAAREERRQLRAKARKAAKEAALWVRVDELLDHNGMGRVRAVAAAACHRAPELPSPPPPDPPTPPGPGRQAAPRAHAHGLPQPIAPPTVRPADPSEGHLVVLRHV